MFATFVYQENKMDFYAAWDLADQQRSTEEPGKSLKATRKHCLPAPLVARSDPYLVKDSKKFEEEEDESDSSSDSSSEDKKTDGLDDDESGEQEKKQQVEASQEKDDTSSSDTEESKTEEDEVKPNPS